MRNFFLRIRDAAGQSFDLPGENLPLSQAIWLSGRARPPALCSGLGRCGRCRVRFLSPAPEVTEGERRILSDEECRAGIRLACRRQAEPGMDVELFPEPVPGRRVHSAVSGELLLAVDLGTTTLEWRTVTRAGMLTAEGRELNPQMGAGSEIMSRLAFAASREKRSRLSELVRESLRGIVRSMPGKTTEICLAANPAMTTLLLDRDINGLAAFPYRLDYPGDRVETLPDLPPLWIPPQISPFVGGDISAGLSFLTARGKPEYPFLFADLGTNGEFVLALGPERALVAAVPLGPALEGIGLYRGCAAGPGAAHAFHLEPDGLKSSVIGGGEAHGICAAGYLSLFRILLRAGLLNPQGMFRYEAATPLNRRLAKHFTNRDGEMRLALPGGLELSAHDVEAVLTVKAAFSLTFARLLARAGLQSGELRRIYIAGALGAYADADDLETLGFFPPGPRSRFTILGNSSLKGAQLFLTEPERREEARRSAQGCEALDPVSDADFHREYIGHMHFGQRKRL